MGSAHISGITINRTSVSPGPEAGMIDSIPKAPPLTAQKIKKTIPASENFVFFRSGMASVNT